MHLSVVSPIYNAENILEVLVSEIEKYVSVITDKYEIILVNDNSPDNSWGIIESICSKNVKVKGINLSRNFGQHYAITAGLDYAIGDWVVVMDCDLQDQPSEIIKLYTKALEGYDIVLARRKNRQDSFLKKFFSISFWKSLAYLTGTNIDHTVANFGIYNSKVVKSISSLKESIRFFPTMVIWVGYKKISVDVNHAERHSGESSYNYSRMFKLAIDVILAYSDKPIRMIIQLGFFISLSSVVIGFFFLYRYLQNQITVPGYASLIISIWFLGGLIIFILGILGLYIGKTFEGVKGRPIYIIDDKINFN